MDKHCTKKIIAKLHSEIHYHNPTKTILTDLAKSQHGNITITKWLSLKNTIEYIGEWEAMHNENFNYTDFGTLKIPQEEITSYYLSIIFWQLLFPFQILKSSSKIPGIY
jgi:hypothetical protein